MMKWIRQHVLFPDHIPKFMYFYLIFAVPLIFSIIQSHGWQFYAGIILTIAFFTCYRLFFNLNANQDKYFLLQLVFACLMCFVNQYFSLFIYTGFLFALWDIDDRTFRRYVAWYLLISSASFIIAFLVAPTQLLEMEVLLWIGFGIVFILLVPFLARFMYKYDQRQVELKLHSSRISQIIKQSERDRIARDLHDNLGQSYSMIALKAELASKLIDRDVERAKHELAELAQSSRAHLNLVRNIVANLHEQTIATVLFKAADQVKMVDLRLKTYQEAIVQEWPLSIQYAFASALQEAITNAVKHSNASLLQVYFDEDEHHYQVVLKDNGQGMQNLKPNGHHFGLLNMTQRIEDIGGTVAIKNMNGVHLTFTIPKQEAL